MGGGGTLWFLPFLKVRGVFIEIWLIQFGYLRFFLAPLFLVVVVSVGVHLGSVFGFVYMSADFPFTQKYPVFNLYLLKTGQVVQMQPACLTFSLALPLAQKKPPLSGEPLNVGHPKHLHMFMFSSVSGTLTPIKITI